MEHSLGKGRTQQARCVSLVGKGVLTVAASAPDFELLDQNGELRLLSDYRGQRVILYFYPKGMTSGCTKQACSFRELVP